MRLFDAHNHLQDTRLAPFLDDVLARARAAGIERMAVKGCSEADWDRVLELAAAHESIHPALGLHPWFVAERTPEWMKHLERLLREHPAASVGEIGIDRAVEPRDDADQEAVFLAQLELARDLDRPVTIHCRRAWGRLIELLDRFGPLPRGLLIHCFGGSAETAAELLRRGAFLSFSGTLTRPDPRKAAAAIRTVPADRLLLETDAPDLLPRTVPADRPFRDERTGRPLNEPAFLSFVLERAAELREEDPQRLAEQTFANAECFFLTP